MSGSGHSARAAIALGLIASILGCGRLRYEPLDASVRDAPGMDVLTLDAPTIDARELDTGPSADAASDGGIVPVMLPTECTRGPLPVGVVLPTITPRPPVVEMRVVPALDAVALANAISSAVDGDVIELEPGVTYVGEYTIRAANITLRTRGIGAAIPTSRRVTPLDAPVLARIESTGGGSPLTILGPDVSLVGLEITTQAANSASLVRTDSRRGTLIDRCYIHGNATGDVRAGVELNGPTAEVRRSHIDEIHHRVGPRPAVLLYTCAGPVSILDSHLEAAGEAVVLGSESASSDTASPHDVAICGNHITRSLRWYPSDPSYAGIPWPTSALLGVSNGQRVLIAGNLIERAWSGGSGGRAFALGPGDFAPANAATVADVVLAWNHVRDVPEVLSLYAGDAGLLPLARVHVSQSLFEPIIRGRFDADTGRILQFLVGPAGPASDVVLDRITAPGAIENGIVSESVTSTELIVRDSILALGDFGLIGAGMEGISGIGALDHLVLIGARGPRYGATSTIVALAGVGFVSPATSNWELDATSPFLTASSIADAPGCDVRALRGVLAGVTP